MADREFTTADGDPVYVSEAFHGERGRYLSFESLDESRRLETYPTHWADLSKQELSMLYSTAEITWRRKR